MAGDSGRKLFVGPRFRRIRQQLGLSQTQMAEGLEISPSYINLIERNQRPVTAQLLLRLAETYDLDLRDLATADEDRFFAELNEIFSDPLFRQIDLPKQELRDLAELVSRCDSFITTAVRRLYRGSPRRNHGRRPDGRSRQGNPIRGQPDRTRARPDRGQPQLLPRTRAGRGNAARRVERAGRRICLQRSAADCAKSTRSSPASCRST